MKRLKNVLNEGLEQEYIWGLSHNLGVNQRTVKNILDKYKLDYGDTFHWFNNVRGEENRVLKKTDLIILFTGDDKSANFIADKILRDLSY